MIRKSDMGAESELADEEVSSEGEISLPDDVPLPVQPDDRERILAILEALLFASPDALTPVRLSEVIGVSVSTIRECLAELTERLDQEERPYELRQHGGAWRLYTRTEYYPFLLRLKQLKRVEKLTPAALETLAVIAYRQPVIRAEIEAIRGVKVGSLLRSLLDRKLIRVVGRAEVPGAPLQYGTTQHFLDRFGLKSLDDLPSLKEFKQGRI